MTTIYVCFNPETGNTYLISQPLFPRHDGNSYRIACLADILNIGLTFSGVVEVAEGIVHIESVKARKVREGNSLTVDGVTYTTVDDYLRLLSNAPEESQAESAKELQIRQQLASSFDNASPNG